MRIIALVAGLLLIVMTFLDGFETILLPRRVNHRLRYSRFYYRGSWALWRCAAAATPAGKWREAALSVFGPLSMLGLFGSWVVGLLVAFALLHWSLASPLIGHENGGSFGTYLYFSGTTFFTLGLGDVSPLGVAPRALAVAEAGLGFAFLAVIISYLPVLYQAFSRREEIISLMDARAGSPPAGGEFLLRLARARCINDTQVILTEWEHWCAQLLESHLSFPVLAYYRSQHANQSWLAALATMLDACALLLAMFPSVESYQAQLTFAMARHAAVDITLIFAVRAHAAPPDRLPPADKLRLHAMLGEAGARASDSPEADQRLGELRATYEPFLAALARHFMLALPPMVAPERSADNWQRSPWMPQTPGIGSLAAHGSDGDHFD